jgi:hypothetical protein
MTSWRVRVEPATGEPWERPLSGQSMVVGRSTDADLPIADRFLSRHHARIFRDGERVLIEDLGSRNGTRVNDVLLDGPRELAAGDVVQLSGSRLMLIADDQAEPVVDERESGVTVYQSASRLLEETSHVHLLSGTLELRRALERLQLLNDVHRVLGHTVDTDELLSLILDRAFDHLSPEEGAIYLLDEHGEPVRAASRAVAGSAAPPVYSRSLVREVIEKGVAALILDVEQDERFHLAHSLLNAGVRSLAAAPLLDGDDVLGMIVLSSRAAKRHFHEPDLQLLVSLASVAALRLRNVRLAADAAERRVLEQEIDLARRIQTALLPSQLPAVPGWSLHAGTVPSRTVSGDLYQALLRRDGEPNWCWRWPTWRARGSAPRC